MGNTHQNKNCIYPLTQKSRFWKFSLTLLVSLCSSHKQLWNLSGLQPKHVIIACMRAAGQLLLCLETPHSWTSAKCSPALRIMFLMQEQKLKGLSGNTADFKSLLEISTHFCPHSIGQRSHVTKSEIIQAVEYTPPMGKAGKDWRQKEKGWQRMRWLDRITESVHVNLIKPRDIVKDREAWYAEVHRVRNSWTGLSKWTIKQQQQWGRVWVYSYYREEARSWEPFLPVHGW